MPIGRILTTLIVAGAVVAGCGGTTSSVTTPTNTSAEATAGPTTAPSTTPAPAGPTSRDESTSSSTTIPPPIELPTGIVPTHVEIPAIDVDANNVTLDLRGPTPEVPSNFAETGWYEQTRLPGEIGPAVIAGHIDSVEGAAVFARLHELVEGDEVIVHGAEGTTRTFVVTGAGRYPKDDLPDEVFGFGDAVPELRLITCGGTFDRTTGHYRDNYVVYTQELTTPR